MSSIFYPIKLQVFLHNECNSVGRVTNCGLLAKGSIPFIHLYIIICNVSIRPGSNRQPPEPKSEMQPITPRIKFIFNILKNSYFRGNFFNFTPFLITGRLNIILKIFNLNIKKKPSLKFLIIDRIFKESNRIFKKI